MSRVAPRLKNGGKKVTKFSLPVGQSHAMLVSCDL